MTPCTSIPDSRLIYESINIAVFTLGRPGGAGGSAPCVGLHPHTPSHTNENSADFTETLAMPAFQ
jgi:hypothetical protein